MYEIINKASSLELDDFLKKQPYFNISTYPLFKPYTLPGNPCAEEIKKDLYYIFMNGLTKIYEAGQT